MNNDKGQGWRKIGAFIIGVALLCYMIYAKSEPPTISAVMTGYSFLMAVFVGSAEVTKITDYFHKKGEKNE